MVARALVAALCLGAIPLTSGQAQARRIRIDALTTLEISYKPDLRIIWAGFRTNQLTDGGAPLALMPEVLRLVGETAKEQGSERFAVTGVFCIRDPVRWMRLVVDGFSCKVQAVPLRPGERVIPQPKDDTPVYLSTQDAIERRTDMAWLTPENFRTGIREKVTIEAGTAP